MRLENIYIFEEYKVSALSYYFTVRLFLTEEDKKKNTIKFNLYHEHSLEELLTNLDETHKAQPLLYFLVNESMLSNLSSILKDKLAKINGITFSIYKIKQQKQVQAIRIKLNLNSQVKVVTFFSIIEKQDLLDFKDAYNLTFKLKDHKLETRGSILFGIQRYITLIETKINTLKAFFSFFEDNKISYLSFTSFSKKVLKLWIKLDNKENLIKAVNKSLYTMLQDCYKEPNNIVFNTLNNLNNNEKVYKYYLFFPYSTILMRRYNLRIPIASTFTESHDMTYETTLQAINKGACGFVLVSITLLLDIKIHYFYKDNNELPEINSPWLTLITTSDLHYCERKLPGVYKFEIIKVIMTNDITSKSIAKNTLTLLTETYLKETDPIMKKFYLELSNIFVSQFALCQRSYFLNKEKKETFTYISYIHIYLFLYSYEKQRIFSMIQLLEEKVPSSFIRFKSNQLLSKQPLPLTISDHTFRSQKNTLGKFVLRKKKTASTIETRRKNLKTF